RPARDADEKADQAPRDVPRPHGDRPLDVEDVVFLGNRPVEEARDLAEDETEERAQEEVGHVSPTRAPAAPGEGSRTPPTDLPSAPPAGAAGFARSSGLRNPRRAARPIGAAPTRAPPGARASRTPRRRSGCARSGRSRRRPSPCAPTSPSTR